MTRRLQSWRMLLCRFSFSYSLSLSLYQSKDVKAFFLRFSQNIFSAARDVCVHTSSRLHSSMTSMSRSTLLFMIQINFPIMNENLARMSCLLHDQPSCPCPWLNLIYWHTLDTAMHVIYHPPFHRHSSKQTIRTMPYIKQVLMALKVKVCRSLTSVIIKVNSLLILRLRNFSNSTSAADQVRMKWKKETIKLRYESRAYVYSELRIAL